ncbi:MAG TPA: ROK family transcriptional regulator [Firmicutes bacterium]|jgi:N-acetylglucosamine repressor|nr:ROK family transcriptional regulator [Bacillota bacterium]
MNNVRQLNRQNVLEAIFSRESTSRKELCSITGLSASTVGLIVNDLIKRGLLYESGAAESDRGRKPIVIRMDPQFVSILAVDVDELSANVYDLHGNALLQPLQMEVEGRPTPDDVVNLVKQCLASIPQDVKLPGVIGISVPGTVDSPNGSVLSSSNLGWRNVPLGDLVTRATGIPTIVESNMVCLTFTEAWFGESSNQNSLVYVHAGWRGVGGGIVINGEIYRGNNSSSAEIGHLQIDSEGETCICGKRGCVETIASGRATLLRARERLSAQGVEDANDLTWPALQEMVAAGDPIAVETMQETARILGQVVVTMVLLFDPAVLVLGGRVLEAHDIILPIVKKMVAEQALLMDSSDLVLGVATDSKEKSMIGAALIAGRSYLFSLS